ncbi:hypothetical protein PGTUg99_026444 [Puccinia graminis f. sp. tritici]|uniref:Uncharacterized protein n=1 Tax=Puccinia graminis f. sp. tritici TaxID=56615 RepID=A0A5B0R8X1_PUCGR|nr:hypothetical protein PGTUg99_026444 [Puccinia graminis f. sp. tritici]
MADERTRMPDELASRLANDCELTRRAARGSWTLGPAQSFFYDSKVDRHGELHQPGGSRRLICSVILFKTGTPLGHRPDPQVAGDGPARNLVFRWTARFLQAMPHKRTAVLQKAAPKCPPCQSEVLPSIFEDDNNDEIEQEVSLLSRFNQVLRTITVV